MEAKASLSLINPKVSEAASGMHFSSRNPGRSWMGWRQPALHPLAGSCLAIHPGWPIRTSEEEREVARECHRRNFSLWTPLHVLPWGPAVCDQAVWGRGEDPAWWFFYYLRIPGTLWTSPQGKKNEYGYAIIAHNFGGCTNHPSIPSDQLHLQTAEARLVYPLQGSVAIPPYSSIPCWLCKMLTVRPYCLKRDDISRVLITFKSVAIWKVSSILLWLNRKKKI